MLPSPNSLPVLRHCQACLRTSREMKTCTRCRRAHYCSPGCQQKDWKSHKTECEQNAATHARIKEVAKSSSIGDNVAPQLDIRKLASDLKKWSKTQRHNLSWAVAQALDLRQNPATATSHCLHLKLEPNHSEDVSHGFRVEEINVYSFEDVRATMQDTDKRRGFDVAVNRAGEKAAALKLPHAIVPIVVIISPPMTYLAPIGVDDPNIFEEDDDWEANFKRAVLGFL